MEPCSSLKDRIGKTMIEEADAKGHLVAGTTMLNEPTSSNTGFELAMVACSSRCWAPSSCSPAERAMGGTVVMGEALLTSIPNAYMLQKFNSPVNPKVA
jgi:cysteine synthase A